MKVLIRSLSYAVTCPGQGIVRSSILAPYMKHLHLIQNDINIINDSLQEKFVQKLLVNDDNWLLKTSNSQPAILVATYLTHILIEKVYGVDLVKGCKFVLGHSLGEYTSLLLTGVLDLPTAVALVRKRGQLMEELVGNDYGMVAILFKPNNFNKIIDQLPSDIVGNINSLLQIILSGKLAHLQLVIDQLNQESKLILKSVKLPVQIPFHSPVLSPVASKLSIDNYNVQSKPIISNLTATPSSESETSIKNTLNANYQPVQWKRSMEFLQSENVSHLINLGPGNVLAGLNKGYKIENVNLDLPDSWNQIEQFPELFT